MKRIVLALLFLCAGVFGQSHTVNGWTIPQMGYDASPNWALLQDSLLTKWAERMSKDSGDIVCPYYTGIDFQTQYGAPYTMFGAASDFNGTMDPELVWGYNIAKYQIASSPRIDTTEPMFKMFICGDYEDGFNHHYVEFNVDYMNPTGTFLKKYMTCTIDRLDTNWAYWGFWSTNFKLDGNSFTLGEGREVLGPTATIYSKGLGEQVRLLSPTGRYRSSLKVSSDGITISAYDDSGSVYLPVNFWGTVNRFQAKTYLDFLTGSTGDPISRMKITDSTMYIGYAPDSGKRARNCAQLTINTINKDTAQGIEFYRNASGSGYSHRIGAPSSVAALVFSSRSGSATDIYDMSIHSAGGEVKIYRGNLTMEAAGAGGGYYSTATHQWTNGSSRTIKKNITSNKMNLRKILDDVEIVNYQYRTGDTLMKHIGFIAEETPSILSGPGKKGMSTGDCIGFLLATVKKQQSEIDALRIMFVFNLGVLIAFIVLVVNYRKK